VNTIDAVVGAIEEDREELAELALTLGNTYGPVGAERATAEVVDGWWRAQGISSRLVEIIEERANVVAQIGGDTAAADAGGTTLIFNAHLDTEASGPDYERLMGVPDPNLTGAWREGERLFGHTILNDRGCMAVFMIAGRALAEHAGPLPGRIVFTSVAGETGQAPVDEYQGVRYVGKGLGSSYLVEHGVVGDYALVAETTNFASCWFNCGAAYYKVTLRGSNMYTPRLVRPDDLRDHPNAIVKAAVAVQAIEEWAIGREDSLSRQTPCGEVRPKAQVGAIRGGIPWRPNRSSPYCALYVDVRLLPDEPVGPVTESLRAAIAGAGIDAEVDLVMAKAGAVADGIGPLADAVADAYRAVRGEPQPPEAEVADVSMWRDTNVFNKAGIPSLTFGPPRGRADVQGRGHFELDDLVDAAKMYALTALQIAGGQTLG
jgi:acetylornithine deacetylase/succinyl-diaminopimelate desuccinylase-like protein